MCSWKQCWEVLAGGLVADVLQRLLTADALRPYSVHLSLHRDLISWCYKRFFFIIIIARALKYVGTSQRSGLRWKLEQRLLQRVLDC